MKKSREIVSQFQEVAKRLKAAAVWSGSLAPVDAVNNDYVYELLCYFHVALSVQATFQLTIAGKTEMKSKRKTARWPRSHALKENFSYIDVQSAHQPEMHFQLCPGIYIKDKHGKRRAPDINLLKGDTPETDPDHTHLHACWDAKHTIRKLKPLSDTAVSDFAYTFLQFNSPPMHSNWKTAAGKPFASSGLITNGAMSSELVEALSEFGISETWDFPSAPKTRP
jgi:hypothetical protein